MGFKNSTAFGWLTSNIMQEATSLANAMPSEWTNIGGIIDGVKKKTIIAWFKTFDQYTTNGISQTKWLCQEYNRSNGKTGIDRREVFVDQENDNNDDWDASAIAAFKSSTTVIKTSEYDEGEETDEEINEKLLKSAKSQSGNYNINRDVDIDVETLLVKYMEDYNLGDIVQVDDGHNTLQTYMITGCIISNDTNDGMIIVPEFEKYEIIPPGYMRVEYIRVSNMLLPIRYCPSENLFITNSDMDYKTSFPDIGPKTISLPQPGGFDNGYNGYINGIINERRSKWTEFEFEGAYNQYEKPSGQSSDLKDNFALLSAIGYENAYGEHLLPYALISSKINKPLRLGYPGNIYNGSALYTGDRYFYQFIGDFSTRTFLYYDENEHKNVYGMYACPGLGIKWETTKANITTSSYINAVYRVEDDSKVHTFYLNKAIEDYSVGINNRLGSGHSPLLKYSLSYVDSKDRCLSKRPQFQFAFVVGYNDWYYYQMSDWEYGEDGTSSYNTMQYNPWSTGGMIEESSIAGLTPLETEEFRKYVFLTQEVDDENTGLWQGAGAYGQIPFNITNTDFNKYRNNSSYRYMILGGYAYKDVEDNLIWQANSLLSYNDFNNGVYVKELKVYEYESSHRIYHYSKYQRNSDDAVVNTWCHKWNGVYSGPDPCSQWDFQNRQSGSENVDLSSRKLTHDYVPVKYVDYGDKEPENIEIYGLYDLIDNVFIPVNYCPDAEIFGEIRNSHATFIEAGGEVPKY